MAARKALQDVPRSFFADDASFKLQNASSASHLTRLDDASVPLLRMKRAHLDAVEGALVAQLRDFRRFLTRFGDFRALWGRSRAPGPKCAHEDSEIRSRTLWKVHEGASASLQTPTWWLASTLRQVKEVLRRVGESESVNARRGLPETCRVIHEARRRWTARSKVSLLKHTAHHLAQFQDLAVVHGQPVDGFSCHQRLGRRRWGGSAVRARF